VSLLQEADPNISLENAKQLALDSIQTVGSARKARAVRK